MSHKPVTIRKLRSNIDKNAPNTASIDEFKAEEFPSSDLGILAGENKGTSTAGGVEGLDSDQLFCQPCDEDENVEVVAEGKTNSRSKKRKRGMTMESYDDDGNDNDENAGSWNGDGNVLTWHRCKDCDYKAKQKSTLKTHCALIHNENVTWHYCKDCDYKSKQKGDLKKHRAAIHDVTWYTCPQHGCEFKAKERSSMKEHIYSHHK